MASVRVYSPDNEPFDVTPSRAAYLRLELGWTSAPFTRTDAAPIEAQPTVVELDESVTGRGRGRRRRAVEAAPVEDVVSEDAAVTDPWRN